MASVFLTKSDLKACLDCRTKLFYRKTGYRSSSDDNEYLKFLADGGFMVEFIAKARFPAGIELSAERNPIVAVERTKNLLSKGDVTLFEAAATSGKYHVRTDILRREGSVLHLIEVKSSSTDEDMNDGASPFITARGKIANAWRPYLVDVAFQTQVLRLAFPEFDVRPSLCLVDKSRLVTSAETLDLFELRRPADNPKARPNVIYHGDIADLAHSEIITIKGVEEEVAIIMEETLAIAEGLAELITPEGVRRVQEDIAQKYWVCRNCEYRGSLAGPDGFRECWGNLADASPHILDLHQVGRYRKQKMPDPIPALLRSGRAAIQYLRDFELGKEGPIRDRRSLQWEASRSGGGEYLHTSISRELAGHLVDPGPPLHFIDFEACRIALPHHPGLHPYELVAFQWSCHKLEPNGDLSHAEWLNPARAFPNFAFAVSLRRQIGDIGTVYVWSPFEQVTLRCILAQIDEWLRRDPIEAVKVAGVRSPADLLELADWITRLLGPEDAKGQRHSPRIRDLHNLARQHYFHPRMGGRTSIKVVLPAVWETNRRLWEHPVFKTYFRMGADGKPEDPYNSLPSLPLGGTEEEDDEVREGTAAVRVYQDLLFSAAPDGRDNDYRRQLLLQYCELDTAAMVMIWMHWNGYS